MGPAKCLVAMGRAFSFGLVGLAAGAGTNAVPHAVIQKKAKPQTNPAYTRPSASVQALARPVGEAWETFSQPGAFIMSLARDGEGKLWAGTEGNGVWEYNPNAIINQQWRQFKTKDGLGDDYAYSVAVDKQGVFGPVISSTASRSSMAHAGKTMMFPMAPLASAFSRSLSVP